ncbi:endoglucanase-1 [Polyplosphaeria fusca]|uniref:Endoglucanase-1 n=1 Tax=Polyplosphaeria fusca TaxID=682080 RepID=A0A9P4R272_9PLEO|nr:endoglucanase-1 [Polyplosphaeria fusca]
MKLATLVSIASTAMLARAAPAQTVSKRADMCGQWDSQVSGPYTLYQDLWGMSSASSGSQCSAVDGISGSTLKWHTKWAWSGGQGSVKSYANVVTNLTMKPLSQISYLPSAWKWTYTGSSIVANVAYDLFTSTNPSSTSHDFEIMIWLGALGGAGPISSNGQPIATVTLAGQSWKLYSGMNGSMKVFSFVASSGRVESFSGDLMEFVNYLTSKQGLSKSQVLQSVGAGTETFTGSGAVFTTTEYSLSMK